MKPGHSGLMVSELTLGTLTFNGQAGFEKTGKVDVRQARRFIEIALERGVNTVDTADLYSKGGAEETLSEAQIKRIEQATRPAPRYPYWHRFTSGMDRLDPAEKVFLDEYQQTLEERKDLDRK